MAGEEGDVFQKNSRFHRRGKWISFLLMLASPLLQELKHFSVALRRLQTFYMVNSQLTRSFSSTLTKEFIFLAPTHLFHLLTLCTQLILARLEAMQGPSTFLLMNRRAS